MFCVDIRAGLPVFSDLLCHNLVYRWDAVHIKKSQKVGFTKENPGAKAVLISGPPG